MALRVQELKLKLGALLCRLCEDHDCSSTGDAIRAEPRLKPQHVGRAPLSFQGVCRTGALKPHGLCVIPPGPRRAIRSGIRTW